MRSPVLMTCTTLVFVLIAAHAVRSQTEPSRSVNDGVYTDVQGTRGEQAYRTDCASCHGGDLRGSGQAPSLEGREFLSTWSGPLADLFDRIHDTMPADRPGQLTLERTADILAFMLKANGFPAGPRELASDGNALKAIRLEASQAPK